MNWIELAHRRANDAKEKALCIFLQAHCCEQHTQRESQCCCGCDCDVSARICQRHWGDEKSLDKCRKDTQCFINLKIKWTRVCFMYTVHNYFMVSPLWHLCASHDTFNVIINITLFSIFWLDKWKQQEIWSLSLLQIYLALASFTSTWIHLMNMAQRKHLHLIRILSSDNLIFFYVIYAKILLDIYRAFTAPKNYFHFFIFYEFEFILFINSHDNETFVWSFSFSPLVIVPVPVTQS